MRFSVSDDAKLKLPVTPDTHCSLISCTDLNFLYNFVKATQFNINTTFVSVHFKFICVRRISKTLPTILKVNTVVNRQT